MKNVLITVIEAIHTGDILMIQKTWFLKDADKF